MYINHFLRHCKAFDTTEMGFLNTLYMRVISQPGWKYFCNALHRRYTAERYFSKLATFARVFSVRVHIKCSITFDFSYTSCMRVALAKALHTRSPASTEAIYKISSSLSKLCMAVTLQISTDPKYLARVTILHGMYVDRLKKPQLTKN